MFDGVKNAMQTGSNMLKAQQTQAKLSKLLNEIRITGISKNGKVTVTVTGEQKIINVKVDPTLIQFIAENFMNTTSSPADIAKGQKMLSDNIMEASNDAIGKVQVEMVKKMQESGGMGDLMEMFKSM